MTPLSTQLCRTVLLTALCLVPRCASESTTSSTTWQPRSPPVIDFFLRTWKGDGVWNIFLLRSIEVNVPPSLYRNIIVVYRQEEDAYFRSYLPRIPLPIVLHPEPDIYVRPGMNGGGLYSQMLSKFMAFKYSDADYFVHVHSDNLVQRPIHLHDLIDGHGRVYVKPVNYDQLHDNFRVWQRHAQVLLKENVSAETMTSFPIVYPRDLYPRMIEHVEQVHSQPFMTVLTSMEDFNEFTPLGAYLMAHMPDRWVEKTIQTDIALQKWSWGGVSPDTVAEFEARLRWNMTLHTLEPTRKVPGRRAGRVSALRCSSGSVI